MYQRIALPLLAALVAIPCLAQTADSSASHTLPVLLSTTAAAPGDSRLVLTAKATVAARLRIQVHATVIDNNLVRSSGGVISQSSHAAIATPTFSTSTAPSASRPQADPALAREVQQKREHLQNEQRAMREENEQPYGGGIPEDRVEQRLTEIPQELGRLPSVPPPSKP